MNTTHAPFRYVVFLALSLILSAAVAWAGDAQPKRKKKAEKKAAAEVAALQEELRAVHAELKKLTEEIERLRKQDAAAKVVVPRTTTSQPTGGASTGTAPSTLTRSTLPPTTAKSSSVPRPTIEIQISASATATQKPAPPVTGAAPATRELAGHTGHITGAAITPDGRWGATAAWDGTVRIWDLAEGRERAVVKTSSSQLFCLAMTPDGKQVYAGGGSGVYVVDVPSGTLRTLPGNRGAYAIALSADGKTLVTANGGSARILNAATGVETKSVDLQVDSVRAVGLTAAGELLCVGGYANNSATQVTYFVRLWNVETGKNVFRLDHPVRTVFRDGVLAPGDKRLFLVGPESSLREYDLTTGNEVKYLDRNVACAAVSGDGKILVAAGSDGLVKLRDIATGRVLQTLSAADTWLDAVGVSADGRHVIVGGSGGTVYYFKLDGAGSAASSSPSSTSTATKSTTAPAVRPVQRLAGHTTYVYAVAVSPDGKRAVSGGFDRSLRLWDLESGRQLKNYQSSGPSRIVKDIAFSPDGKQLLLGSGQTRGTQRLKLWDVEKWEEIKSFEGHDHVVTCVAISPDGKTAASGSLDATARLWDIASGKQLHLLTVHTNSIEDVAFSSDGSTLATCSDDGTLRIWDVATGRELRKLSMSGANGLAFSPTRAELLAGGGSLRMWDYENGVDLRTYTGHGQTIGNVCISPDGKRILSAGFDKQARLHDAAQGRLLLSVPAGLPAHSSPVAFGLGGRRFITVDADNVLEVWDVPQ